MLSAAAVVAGVVVALTLQSLLAYLPVMGGVAGLGVTMLPASFERIGMFLSSGSVRRKPKD